MKVFSVVTRIFLMVVFLNACGGGGGGDGSFTPAATGNEVNTQSDTSPGEKMLSFEDFSLFAQVFRGFSL